MIIFIYFSQQKPCDNQNTVLFSSDTFFLFYYAKQENTQCNKTEDSDSAVLSLPFHSARLYTQEDCTSSLYISNVHPQHHEEGKVKFLKQSF